MAQPIPFELPKRDAREELRTRLEQAPLEHAEAVLAGFEVLQCLHDQGVLEILRGVLGGGDKILAILVDAAKEPEAIRGLRNLIILSKMAGSIDPELLKRFALALPEALESAAKTQQAKPPSLWETFRILRGENMRRGIAAVNNLLDVVKRNFTVSS
jgi:uncharacterized protein YjgD (DUF1641 family)